MYASIDTFDQNKNANITSQQSLKINSFYVRKIIQNSQAKKV